MQFPVKEAEPIEQKVALVQVPNLRLCSIGRTPAAKPVSSAKIDWQICTSNSVLSFSAVAAFFAHELLKDPGLAAIPMGVVDCSFGGTTCEAWIPAPALTNFAPQDLHDSFLGFKPAQHYNGMIAPLGHMALKGVLWYQGESNSGHPDTYQALLATMISEWRKQFEQPGLPFLIIQLPEYANLWEGFYWPWIREIQAKSVQSIPNTALVVALRTTDGFKLHPKEKLEIGRRAALVARKFVYGESLIASGPIFKEATVEGSTLRVKFDTAGDGLASTTPERVQGFAVAGADGEYYFAEARLEGESVVVWSDRVPKPRTVRYAWAAMPQCTLINRSGLPAAPFRTDQLPYSNVEVQPTRSTRRVATSAYELVIGDNGMPTSLLVHGAQFLSNEPGSAGGGSIPGFWGPRALATIRELGPRLLACSDDDVTLQMAFEEKSMQWTLTNRSKDAITYQLALSSLVRVQDSVAASKTTVYRGDTSLTLEGFDSITNTPTGALLISNIKPGAATTISLR
jgi:sialate O-acetylesterase